MSTCKTIPQDRAKIHLAHGVVSISGNLSGGRWASTRESWRPQLHFQCDHLQHPDQRCPAAAAPRNQHTSIGGMPFYLSSLPVHCATASRPATQVCCAQGRPRTRQNENKSLSLTCLSCRIRLLHTTDSEHCTSHLGIANDL
jgi:hypothetical protein